MYEKLSWYRTSWSTSLPLDGPPKTGPGGRRESISGRTARWLLLGGMVFLISACGFQLRGAADLPEAMDRTFVSLADGATEFARDLDRQLRANGVVVVTSPDQASAILDIPVARMQRRPLTISGTAQVREYELVFTVEYQVLDAAGQQLVPRDTIVLRRSYSFDEQEILAATREEEFLRADLSSAMSGQLLRRLEAGSGS